MVRGALLSAHSDLLRYVRLYSKQSSTQKSHAQLGGEIITIDPDEHTWALVKRGMSGVLFLVLSAIGWSIGSTAASWTFLGFGLLALCISVFSVIKYFRRPMEAIPILRLDEEGIYYFVSNLLIPWNAIRGCQVAEEQSRGIRVDVGVLIKYAENQHRPADCVIYTEYLSRGHAYIVNRINGYLKGEFATFDTTAADTSLCCEARGTAWIAFDRVDYSHGDSDMVMYRIFVVDSEHLAYANITLDRKSSGHVKEVVEFLLDSVSRAIPPMRPDTELAFWNSRFVRHCDILEIHKSKGEDATGDSLWLKTQNGRVGFVCGHAALKHAVFARLKETTFPDCEINEDRNSVCVKQIGG